MTFSENGHHIGPAADQPPGGQDRSDAQRPGQVPDEHQAQGTFGHSQGKIFPIHGSGCSSAIDRMPHDPVVMGSEPCWVLCGLCSINDVIEGDILFFLLSCFQP